MRSVELGQIALDVIDRGQGPLALFLHGFPERAIGWSPIIDRLSTGLRCVAPDQRGYSAASRWADDRCYAVDELMQDIDALLDALGAPSAMLIGHDWGGIIASWFACRQPQRVNKLVLINGPHPAALQRAWLDSAEQRAASAYIERLRAPGAAAALLADGAEAMWQRYFGGLPAMEGKHAAYVSGWSEPGALEAMLGWYRAAPFVIPAAAGAAPPGWLDAEAFRVSCPTQVIWGMQDRALPPSLLAYFPPCFDDLQIITVDHAGHGIIHQEAALVARHIEAFARA